MFDLKSYLFLLDTIGLYISGLQRQIMVMSWNPCLKWFVLNPRLSNHYYRLRREQNLRGKPVPEQTLNGVSPCGSYIVCHRVCAIPQRGFQVDSHTNQITFGKRYGFQTETLQSYNPDDHKVRVGPNPNYSTFQYLTKQCKVVAFAHHAPWIAYMHDRTIEIVDYVCSVKLKTLRVTIQTPFRFFTRKEYQLQFTDTTLVYSMTVWDTHSTQDTSCEIWSWPHWKSNTNPIIQDTFPFATWRKWSPTFSAVIMSKNKKDIVRIVQKNEWQPRNEKYMMLQHLQRIKQTDGTYQTILQKQIDLTIQRFDNRSCALLLCPERNRVWIFTSIIFEYSLNPLEPVNPSFDYNFLPKTQVHNIQGAAMYKDCFLMFWTKHDFYRIPLFVSSPNAR